MLSLTLGSALVALEWLSGDMTDIIMVFTDYRNKPRELATMLGLESMLHVEFLQQKCSLSDFHQNSKSRNEEDFVSFGEGVGCNNDHLLQSHPWSREKEIAHGNAFSNSGIVTQVPLYFIQDEYCMQTSCFICKNISQCVSFVGLAAPSKSSILGCLMFICFVSSGFDLVVCCHCSHSVALKIPSFCCTKGFHVTLWLELSPEFQI